MKLDLTEEQRQIIDGLTHHRVFGYTKAEVVRGLLDYAIRRMVEEEYVQKTMAMRIAGMGE